MAIETFTKDPDARLDYDIDWSEWLGTDTIVTSQWIVPAPLSLFTSSYTTTKTFVWVSGGVVGARYSLVNRVTTAGGRIDDRTINIKIKEQ